MRIECVGGPADGAFVAASGVFRWVCARRRMGFARPAPGRALYQRSGGCWRFAGEECWQCVCGAVVVARVRRCLLCGMERDRQEEALDG